MGREIRALQEGRPSSNDWSEKPGAGQGQLGDAGLTDAAHTVLLQWKLLEEGFELNLARRVGELCLE